MDSVVKVRECQWCHEPYYLSDGRYKYCSDECAEKARFAKENRRKLKNTPRQSFKKKKRRSKRLKRLFKRLFNS
ncbi:MAG: hypothetical protein IJG80_03840 [Selenomonadaceae bacterium]|nr:hypothetical protein [Selenomonadaceae bacterium]MBQ3727535.1 hypothetical protein [Selenomonadaceae bacterium]